MSKENMKAFQIRLPVELWRYLKRAAIDQEISLNELIKKIAIRYRNTRDDLLTNSDTMVS